MCEANILLLIHQDQIHILIRFCGQSCDTGLRNQVGIGQRDRLKCLYRAGL